MKLAFVAAAAALIGAPAIAKDYNFKVTNNSGKLMAPLIILDAAMAEQIMFSGGAMSEDFVTTILEGDPRPMNGKIGAGVAGPVLGKSGPPGVLIAADEVAETDLFIESETLRFYAKTGYGDGSDTFVSGVWDIAMGDGTLLLDLYDMGNSEGTNEITRVAEGVIEVVITEN